MTEMLNQDSRLHDDQGLTREAWLHRAIEAFRPRFAEIGLPLPAKLHVSVGFGYSTRAESKYILGQCWARRASADGVNHIFLGPQEGDPAGMLVSLLHELIHAADDCASGHKGAFAEAATRIAVEQGSSVALFGSEAERTLCEAIGESLRGRGLAAVDLAGRTSLREFIDLAAACRLFLTNDSGAMHIASAAGVRTVAIFGATDEFATGPTGPLSRVVREKVDCSPCLLRECPIDHRCMTRVTPERVAGVALELLR